MKIEFSEEVKIGDKSITSIEVNPLTFQELGEIWDEVRSRGTGASIQRARIKRQGVFKAGETALALDDASLGQFPIRVAKDIIAALDVGQGEAGEVVLEGDGIATPIVYKLGAPIRMKNSKGEETSITELEFIARVYSDIEDILSADHDVAKTIALLRLAKPMGSSLSKIPEWALDRFTVADGVTMMTKVLPHF